MMSLDDEQLPHKAPRRHSIDEGPDVADMAADSGEFAPCPFCRKLIFDDAEQCPYCKHFITHAIPPRQPWWLIITALVLVFLMIMYYVVGLPIPIPG
jgi:hypothetical protein